MFTCFVDFLARFMFYKPHLMTNEIPTSLGMAKMLFKGFRLKRNYCNHHIPQIRIKNHIRIIQKNKVSFFESQK